MPVTPAHIAAVVPLRHLGDRRLPFSAMAIGSVVPDWSLYTPYSLPYHVTHSLTGVLGFGLTVGLLLYYVFECVFKQPIIHLLPEPLQQRIRVKRRYDWRSFGFAVAAVLIGASTHVVWDSFTHEGQWGVMLLPVLNTPVLSVGGSTYCAYKVLQYFSSVFGLLVLVAAIWRWYLRTKPSVVEQHDSLRQKMTSRVKALLWVALVSASLMSAIFAGYHATSERYSDDRLSLWIFEFITHGTSTLLIGLLGYSVWYWLKRRQTKGVLSD